MNIGIPVKVVLFIMHANLLAQIAGGISSEGGFEKHGGPHLEREVEFRAVFTLVKDYPDRYDYCGTAFFVSADGYFLTAAHIFEYEPTAHYFAILDPRRPQILTPFQLIWVSNKQDLVVGKIDVAVDYHLKLAESIPADDSEVSVIGYLRGSHKEGRLRLGRTFGKFLAYTDSYSIAAKPQLSEKDYPAIVSYPACAPGYSGGPLLDHDGNVVGLHSASDSDAAVLKILKKDTAVAISVHLKVLKTAVQNYVPTGNR